MGVDVNMIFLILFLISLFIGALIVGGFFAFSYFKTKGREETSIDSVLLQVAVPKGNEVKIDAMEQLFA